MNGQRLLHDLSMRICLLLCLCLCMASPALAQVAIFPAPSGKADAETLVVYSSLDEPLATPMIEGFQKANPDIAVHYEDMLTGEIYDRIVKETDAGKRPPISPFHPPWICR